MSKYILSLSLLLLPIVLVAQQQEEPLSKEEKKLANRGNPGISFGIDLAPFITHLFANERFGVEANARYTINRKWQVVSELGYENVDLDTDEMTYTSNGSFIRAGIDYNIFKVEELGNNDNILLGFRYGAAIQEHSCPRYTIKEEYWGDTNGSLGSSTVGSHWGEFVFGLRSEILKNFYMGWSVRFKTIINVGKDNAQEPYSIPGYGSRDRSSNMGFTYTLEYQIPFKKK
ncbi:DUF6048 family protein [Carboxylicivirga marina]|uniref:Outer membrane protein beta-barrel domain-containing protein n=1 Tax=Carboxylicivirga marina TaxID=2800988 RepID=A0ABS1HLH4_9BACT|nr:DUF6048 family protein [Carboxylicivirga marina]MBK3518534.1 hypothetical protein [Carboxylicivirga marina]